MSISKRIHLKIDETSFQFADGVEEPEIWLRLTNTGSAPIYTAELRLKVYTAGMAKPWIEEIVAITLYEFISAGDSSRILLDPLGIKHWRKVPRDGLQLEMVVMPVKIMTENGDVVYDEKELIEVMNEMSRTKLELNWLRSKTQVDQ